VSIIKRPFYADYLHLERFEALIKSWQAGLILAHNIVLLREEGQVSVCVVEYGYLDFKEGYMTLKDWFRKDVSLRNKLKVFKQVLKLIRKLHKIGAPHLSLNPERIWLWGNFKHLTTIEVFLCPFIVDFENPDDVTSDLWYAPPEFLFNSPDFYNRFECDLWAMGCILFDIFSPTPLLQVSEHHWKLLRLFEVFGFPSIDQIPFVNENTY
jgi:serine/threonine protein kinase